jgi:uncharacterized protein (TIGR00725 family)
MDLLNRPRIGIMGPSACGTRPLDLARETGRLIARRGGILICGGRRGVMEAAAAGAKEAGGITVGILPGVSASEANPYIDIPIVTGMRDARNCINVLTSQVIIAIHGSYGTLSEIALALKCGTPVVALESWSLIPPGQGLPVAIITADSPQTAVDAAWAAIHK